MSESARVDLCVVVAIAAVHRSLSSCKMPLSCRLCSSRETRWLMVFSISFSIRVCRVSMYVP